MTASQTAHPLPDDERITAIRDRLSALRQTTAALAERAHEAAAHAEETRTSRRAGCSHAAEAEEMRVELDALEQELEGLRVAMNTRGVIEQAKGMLMLRQRCDADAAFAMLVSMSQRSHHKLVDVARQVVAALPEGDDCAT